MDADPQRVPGTELEPVAVVLDGEAVPIPPRGGALARARAVLADPRVQGAAAAGAGMLVGAATVTLLRRAGQVAAPAEPRPAWAARPPAGPIAPGTYIVRIRAIHLPPA